MKHFLDISQLHREDVLQLLARAEQIKSQSEPAQFFKQTLANLFYEPSTRTRISFEMAAKNLGMRVVNMDVTTSSETKGEMIEDTIHNLHAMGISYFVIRHSQEGLPRAIATAFSNGIHGINI